MKFATTAVLAAIAWSCGIYNSHLLVLSQDVAVNDAVNNTCFELPVVIFTPLVGAFPTKKCVQAPKPSEDCRRRVTLVNVEVIDHGRSTNADNGNTSTAIQWNCADGPRTNIYPAKAHFRGQSSLGFSKHQYSVQLNETAEFLGFPADRDFVLNGPVIDGSLIRNHLAHALFRATGRYSPRTRHIVVFVKDTGTNTLKYQGIYLALEKIAYGSHRVGLAPLTNQCHGEEELSGGWAWQLNPLNYGVYSPNVITDQYQIMFGSGERPVLMYPKPYALTQSMRDYFVDPTTGPLPKLYRYLYDNITNGDQLREFIDLGSFADYLLHSELSQNSDAYRRSTYFFKDRGQPINAGPVWDFNLAFGSGANQRAWLFPSHFLWKRLVVNYQFVALLAKRWRMLRADVWSDQALTDFITTSTAPLKRQLKRCGPRWFGKRPQCAWTKTHGVYEQHVARVQQAVLARAKWMDENIARLYAKQDWKIWNPATNLPAYNCAADGNDAGCLNDPETYIAKAEMPPIRYTQSENKCTGKADEEPSIDPCWLSTGTTTLFCSGNGFCPQGPGAKCECLHNTAPPMCTKNDAGATNATLSLGEVDEAEEELWGMEEEELDDEGVDETEEHVMDQVVLDSRDARFWSGVGGYLTAVGLLVVVVAYVARRRQLTRQSHEHAPLSMNPDHGVDYVPSYGT